MGVVTDFFHAVDSDYVDLACVLMEALDRAQFGKGKERHAQNGQRFEDQPIMQISKSLHSHKGLLFQAVKKLYESDRLAPDAAIAELYDAVIYISAAAMYIAEEAGIATPRGCAAAEKPSTVPQEAQNASRPIPRV